MRQGGHCPCLWPIIIAANVQMIIFMTLHEYVWITAPNESGRQVFSLVCSLWYQSATMGDKRKGSEKRKGNRALEDLYITVRQGQRSDKYRHPVRDWQPSRKTDRCLVSLLSSGHCRGYRWWLNTVSAPQDTTQVLLGQSVSFKLSWSSVCEDVLLSA